MTAHTDPHADVTTPSTQPSVLDFSKLRVGAPQSTALLSRSELDRYLAAARADEPENAA
jgi:hypothetical protein